MPARSAQTDAGPAIAADGGGLTVRIALAEIACWPNPSVTRRMYLPALAAETGLIVNVAAVDPEIAAPSDKSKPSLYHW